MSAPAEAQRKRKRLTYACSQCRARKVKCDERYPKCSNCVKSGTECITFDPRNPNSVVQRREAQKPAQLASPGSVRSTGTTDSVVRLKQKEPGVSVGQSSRNEASIDDQQESEDLLPALPRQAFGYGNSLQMLSQWLDLAFARLDFGQRFSMQSGSSRQKPAVQCSGNSPLHALSLENIRERTKCFMNTENTVFPIFSDETMRKMVQSWEQYSLRDSATIDDDTVPGLFPILLTLVVGASSAPKEANLSKACLDYAMFNFEAILDDATVHAVQSLFLVALILRCRDEISLSPSIITLAASTAQSMGLHRQTSPRRLGQIDAGSLQEQINVWWSVFVLEKVISLELGRLSTIRDFECNQIRDVAAGQWRSPAIRDAFHALIDLAKLQSEINERFAQSRHVEETTSNIEEAIRSKMEMVGELDQQLLLWAQQLPPQIRPLDQFGYSSELMHSVPFLALQYWQTLFLLHRNSLLLNLRAISSRADSHFHDKPYRYRFKSGQSISCHAARTIISTLNGIDEQEESVVLRSSHAPLLAVYALGIHILRNPHLGMARADFEVQANAIEIITKHQQRIGTYEEDEPTALRELLNRLHSQVAARLHGSTATSARGTPAPQNPSGTDGVYLAPQNHNQWPFDPSDSHFGAELGFSSFDNLDIDWNALSLAYDLPN